MIKKKHIEGVKIDGLLSHIGVVFWLEDILMFLPYNSFKLFFLSLIHVKWYYVILIKFIEFSLLTTSSCVCLCVDICYIAANSALNELDNYWDMYLDLFHHHTASLCVLNALRMEKSHYVVIHKKKIKLSVSTLRWQIQGLHWDREEEEK